MAKKALKKAPFQGKKSTFLAKKAVADPGFPVGGVDPLGGHGPPTQVLTGKNVCKNERIGSRRRGRAPGTPPRSANGCDNRTVISLQKNHSESEYIVIVLM